VKHAIAPLIIALLLLSGCVNSVRTAAPGDVELQPAALYVYGEEEEQLTAESKRHTSASTAGGMAGGFIGSLIGSAIDAANTKADEKEAAQLASEVVAITEKEDLREHFLVSFEETCGKRDLPVVKSRVMALDTAEEGVTDSMINEGTPYVIRINPVFKYNPARGSLRLHYIAEVLATDPQTMELIAERREDPEKKNHYYRNFLSVEQPVPDLPRRGNFASENEWKDALSDKVLSYIAEASRKAAILLHYDLSLDEVPDPEGAESITVLSMIGGVEHKGRVEKEFSSGEVAVRIENEALYMLPSSSYPAPEVSPGLTRR
jgi:hypothetical protein